MLIQALRFRNTTEIKVGHCVRVNMSQNIQHDENVMMDMDYNLNRMPKEACTDEGIAHVLHYYYQKDHPFVECGANALIVINPYRQLAVMQDETSTYYLREERKVFNRMPLPPHLFSIASSIYQHIIYLKQDQGVILR
jgi:myosin heavy subunit